MATLPRYTRTAIALHWMIALLLLGQFAFGLMLDDIPRGTPARGYYVNLHKSTGILIGLLILLRLGWRLTHTPPPLPNSMPRWQRRAARASHIALYACMLALLVGLHVLAVAKHMLIDRDGLLLRMWPQRGARVDRLHSNLSVENR